MQTLNALACERCMDGIMGHGTKCEALMSVVGELDSTYQENILLLQSYVREFANRDIGSGILVRMKRWLIQIPLSIVAKN